MYILASNMWFTTLIRQFFFLIDKVVYNFISSIYNVLIAIARTSVLSQADIANMADRIYKLLAIFMVFKVTLSLITYVVNPDDFSDKSKGISKLSRNIIISLSLLILTPYLFNYAYQFQKIILEDNSLSVLIFGEESTANGEDSFFNSAGDKIAYTTISAFFSPNLSLGGLIACDTISEIQGEKRTFSQECSNALEALLDPEGILFTKTSLENYKIGVEKGNFGMLFRQDLAIATNPSNDGYIMDYKFIFSTVVGVVIILLLINFCMDVAVRSIKLAFLQLIAPIPIISYVDPKSGKDGLFKKWYDMCFKTYLSLFIRLLSLYFAIYIIEKVSDLRLVDVVDGSYVTNGIIAIFVIIGALMFAKQLPKLLEGLGIKLDGGGKFTLNPLRKIENEALGGKLLKKPNDMLAKGAKALALSPFRGASLGARKLIAGVDSAAHGKGFWNGTKNVQGKLAQAKNKFMEKNLPHTAKSLKDKKEARDEIALMNSNWKKGEKAIKRFGGDLSQLDGKNTAAYRKMGFSGEFLNSKKNLDYATERKKVLQRLYNARQMATSQADIEKIKTDEFEIMNKYGIDASLLDAPSKLSQALDDQTKSVSGLEKVHESNRKADKTQADLEDQIKFVKYNKINPVTGETSILYKPESNSNGFGSGTESSASESSSDTSTESSTSESSSDTSTESSASESSSDTSTVSTNEEPEEVTSDEDSNNVKNSISESEKIEIINQRISELESELNKCDEYLNEQIKNIDTSISNHKKELQSNPKNAYNIGSAIGELEKAKIKLTEETNAMKKVINDDIEYWKNYR